MPEIQTFNLPDLGEGLTDGEILRWFVAPGDTVMLNQPIVEVETAKAAVEIPSPFAGVVTTIHHPEGATIEVGTPIIAIDVSTSDPYDVPGPAAGENRTPAFSGSAPPSGPNTPAQVGSASSAADPMPAQASSAPAAQADEAASPAGDRTPVLVGYGPRTGTPRRRPRRMADAGTGSGLGTDPIEPEIGGSGLVGDPAEPEHDETLALLPTIPDALATGAKPVRHGGLEMGRAAERAAQAASPVAPLPGVGVVPAVRTAAAAKARAKPPVRKLARDLGVDLATVPATGPHGTVSRDDIQRAAASVNEEAAPTPAVTSGADVRERRVAVRGVRKLTAEAMVASVSTAPHVTEFLTVDMTKTLKAVTTLRADPAFADVRVGPLLLIAKAVLLAVGRHPELNASWASSPAGDEIVLKEYVNLGIAAATPRGLLVPNIKDAGRLPLPALAAELQQLVGVAKAGKTAPADLTGGTITITNVGVFGVDAGTPILNPGEAAILCVGQIAERPWVHKGEVKARSVCQLALSFDHRIVDGEGGSKFLADIGRFLADPTGTALAWS